MEIRRIRYANGIVVAANGAGRVFVSKDLGNSWTDM